MTEGASRSILALISTRGGGDAPPVLALAVGLRDRGHRVRVMCDAGTEAAVTAAGLSAIRLPAALEQGAYFERVQPVAPADGSVPYPLLEWANASVPAARAALGDAAPDAIVASLFCLPLAALLADAYSCPWAFINPAYYFGDGSARAWEEDFAQPSLTSFRDRFLPLARRATLVLHATDPRLDFPPARLPANHHYVGPLLWDLPAPAPAFLHEPGVPWVLVSLSTHPHPGDLAIARGAIRALADRDVRVLVTLAPGHHREELGTLPANARLAGYVPHNHVVPASRLVVAHAGHGIVSKALSHGVPLVLVPQGRDQPGVAARAAAAGVAMVVAREECTDERLATAIARVLTAPQYMAAAQAMAVRLQATDAIDMACRHVAQL